jgi:glycosyltransferase involved in cell wall biosynthesis
MVLKPRLRRARRADLALDMSVQAQIVDLLRDLQQRTAWPTCSSATTSRWCGRGETLFLREIWPDARQVLYAEFYYAAHGLDADFDPEFQTPSLGRAIRTLAMRGHIAQAMADADLAVAPTRWQADTFPPPFRDRIEVVFDGVDTDALRPDPEAAFQVPETDIRLRHGDEVLTYVARNLEPHRGIHTFLRALPGVLARRPEAQVVVVGADGVSYGSAPAAGGTWKDAILSGLAQPLDPRRVHFTGRLGYGDYCRLLQVSRVHAYLTYPFVLSWSLMEAMATGAAVVASRTGPVEEVIANGVNGRLVDFFDVAGWEATLGDALARPEALVPLREAARRTVEERYALRTCLPRLIALVEGAARP